MGRRERRQPVLVGANPRGRFEYRIEGNRSSAFEALLEIEERLHAARRRSGLRNACCLSGSRRPRATSDFEILLSAQRPAGLLGQLDTAGARGSLFHRASVLRRLGHRERPARISRSTASAAKASSSRRRSRLPGMAGLLDEAGLVDAPDHEVLDGVDRPAARDHVKGELREPRPFVGGAADIVYGNDWWSLEPDEAMIVETEVPDARYWQVQLCDVWFRTMDWATRQTGLNALAGANRQMTESFRCRRSPTAIPGVQNWLDTGRPSGGHAPVPLDLDAESSPPTRPGGPLLRRSEVRCLPTRRPTAAAERRRGPGRTAPPSRPKGARDLACRVEVSQSSRLGTLAP